MRIFVKLLNLLAVPIMLLNLLAGVIGGIWLAFLGEWSIIISGIVFIVVSMFALALILLPTVPISVLIMKLWEKKVILGVAFFSFLSLAYIYFVMIMSSNYVFSSVFSMASAESGTLPLLLWSYAVATAPWSAMASKEENDSTFFSLFSLQIALIVAMILIGGGMALDESFGYVVLIMIVPLVYGTYFAVKTLRNGGDNILMGNSVSDSSYSNNELALFISSLVVVADADEKFTSKEIVEIQSVFKEVSGEGVSKKFIKQIHSNIAEIKNGLLDDIEQCEGAMSGELKKSIIIGMCLVAIADNKIHEQEKAHITKVADSLRLSNAQTSTYVKEAVVASKK